MSTADSLPSAERPVASGTMKVHIVRAGAESRVEKDDRVAVEAPLEYLLHHPVFGVESVSFGTTMRTPGDDEYLAAGLLYGEGIVNAPADIDAIESSTRRPNVVNVRLHSQVHLDVQMATRRFSAGSSCGVCGTTGLDAAIARAAATRIADTGAIELELLMRLPQRMREAQSKFGDTGGIHACALFDFSGNLITIAEDVGRHNAFDKLVGANLLAGRLPLKEHIILLSGRASFERAPRCSRPSAPHRASRSILRSPRDSRWWVSCESGNATSIRARSALLRPPDGRAHASAVSHSLFLG
jgi:FdhD protein